ncbi:MAG: beta strand repeat-containing protein [Burkholderiales bacterium]|nr:hypothetical protein [Betaproteobacteria bacterium]
MANQIYTGTANDSIHGLTWRQRGLIVLLIPLLSALLSACGGGGVSGSTGSGGTGPSTGTPTLTLTLTDPSTNAAVTTVAPGKPAKVSATFRTGTNTPIAGAVVTFRTDSTLGTFVPTNAAAVTDASGVASVLLYPSTSAGAATVTGSTQTVVAGSTSTTAITGSVAFTATPSPAITVGLFDPGTGAARTSISAGNPARVAATLRQVTGAPAPGVVVTFTTDPTLGTFSPTSGSALTDTNGVASIILNSASLTASGAGIVTASGQIGSGTTASAVSSTVGFSTGAINITLSQVTIATPLLSAFGTTAVSVTVNTSGVATPTPFNVNFTSPCATNGRAALTPSVATVNGVATASYRDIGCAGTDIITATVTGLALTGTGTVTVSPPGVGSIQYVASTPTSISLRGTGGLGRQETSQVSFRVVDIGGNPLGGRTVTFNLNTTVGGISLSSTTATSDPATGLVITNVQSGTVSTPVRVTASTSTGTQTLTTQSDQLTVTTGIPAQEGFSISRSTINIEGWEYDGVTTQLTVRMSDHFRNPVPDGTALTFTAEGGSIASSCVSVNGTCTVSFTSQAIRPTNGRVTVLAYAVGEEGFTDLNGNGWFDLSPTSELIDSNGKSTDIGEAFVDFNENGIRDANEPFIDFNNNGIFDGPDGKYSGVLCDETVPGRSSPGSCATSKTLHVRGSTVVVLSGSRPIIDRSVTTTGLSTYSVGTPPAIPSITLESCWTIGTLDGTNVVKFSPNPPSTFIFDLRDDRGNALPAGTTVSFATSNGRITSTPSSFVVPNSAACFNPGTGSCPASAAQLLGSEAGRFTVSLQSDAIISGTTCTNTNLNGTLTMTVTTPRGVVTTASVSVTD